jgi:hypothetical protein
MTLLLQHAIPLLAVGMLAFTSPQSVGIINKTPHPLSTHSRTRTRMIWHPRPYIPLAEDRRLTVALRSSSEDARTCLIAAAWTEARGQGRRAILGVMEVVRNRVLHPAFPPNTICGIVLQPGQFYGAETHRLARAAARGQSGRPRPHDADEARVLTEMEDLADDVIAGRIKDPTGCATHFYEPALRQYLGHKRPPDWAREFPQTAFFAGTSFHRQPGGVCHSSLERMTSRDTP